MTLRHALLGVAILLLPGPGVAQVESSAAHPKGDMGSWFPMNIYPPEAKRKGEQGRVVAELAVDATGSATACKIIESSSSASLDARTCELALANARFKPAQDASGQPIASTYRLPGVRWVLNDVMTTDLSAGPNSTILKNFEIDVDERGIGLACRAIGVAQGAGGCENFKPGGRVTGPLIRGGKPVTGTLTVTTTMRIEAK